MVLTRPGVRPVVFDQPAHQTREDNVWEALCCHNPDLEGKRVLDLGCGWGGFGKKAAAMGAQVLFVDGRPENLAVAKEAGPEHTYLQMDITKPYWEPPPVDVSLCLGVLYHVGDPGALLRKAACAPVLAVETISLDHDGEFLVKLDEDPAQVDYSLNGGACRPSPGWIVNQLEKLGYTKIVDLLLPTIPATNDWAGAIWDWDYERTCGWRRNEHQLRKLFLALR